jgi:hypothetical protein
MILGDELPPENNSQEAGSNQSNEGWRGKRGKRFLKRQKRK